MRATFRRAARTSVIPSWTGSGILSESLLAIALQSRRVLFILNWRKDMYRESRRTACGNGVLEIMIRSSSVCFDYMIVAGAWPRATRICCESFLHGQGRIA